MSSHRRKRASTVTVAMRRSVRDQISFVQGMIDLATDTKDCSEPTRKALYDVQALLKTCTRRVDAILRGEDVQEEPV